ncbi:hypothetical protein DEA8626_04078 [Defluviimonas aquaemixtae]|uniref:Uncharacterized protein n=2 Tax=Albidovulum aquaemixtae TaxID=1542388 RepID=A0A2R8BNM9_9RHOB|nr:hypothetical protein DEA8626_04078 [Defluviimonas aquaemixtae]
MDDSHDKPEVIEGKLIAHRRILAALLATVIGDGPAARERLRRMIADDAIATDHAEDPGVFPDSAFAISSTVAEEFRLIAREAAEIQAAAGAAD